MFYNKVVCKDSSIKKLTPTERTASPVNSYQLYESPIFKHHELCLSLVFLVIDCALSLCVIVYHLLK